MGRYPGLGKNTVEYCRFIDILCWNRRGYFQTSRRFSWEWTGWGQDARIDVETQHYCVTLRHRTLDNDDVWWDDGEQRVPIQWTACRFGGERPWFVCSAYSGGVYCGCMVTKLYNDGRLFACRHCYRLVYKSQQETVLYRDLSRAQKIRKRLGGSLDIDDAFPQRPKGMHWRTYNKFRRIYDVAGRRLNNSMARFAERLGR